MAAPGLLQTYRPFVQYSIVVQEEVTKAAKYSLQDAVSNSKYPSVHCTVMLGCLTALQISHLLHEKEQQTLRTLDYTER